MSRIGHLFKCLSTPRLAALAVLLAFAVLAPASAWAQDAAAAPTTTEVVAEEAAAPAPTAADAVFTANNLWMMVSIGLVFSMHLGFALLESGLCRRKNVVNILTKNAITPMLGVLTYAIVGFNLMYPGDNWTVPGWVGSFTLGIGTDAEGVTAAYNPGYTYWTDFLFQAMFCATACTIVSGAVAERIKFMSYFAFATVFTLICYPVIGSWKWGGGWLNELSTPFYDFAGSTLVHSVGGWAALVGVFLLGPRIGKYTADGRVSPIPGHNMPLATIGTFILFLGWFGFNGGSVLSADPALTSLVLVTTTLAGAAGMVAAVVTSNVVTGKPDLSMALNGALAGLVGITAGADQMAPMSSVIIGLISGVLVVLSVVFFDKIKLDDPVGALSVHLVCGIFGTLAVGLFGAKAGVEQFVSQAIGVGAAGAATVVASFVIFGAVKLAMGLRVSEAEELEGLDIGEHGMEGYPGFGAESTIGGEVPGAMPAAGSAMAAAVAAAMSPTRTADATA